MRFAHLKTHHGFERLRLRGLSGARDEFHLAAIVQNLRTLACVSSGRRQTSRPRQLRESRCRWRPIASVSSPPPRLGRIWRCRLACV
jgi:hypothetical protein